MQLVIVFLFGAYFIKLSSSYGLGFITSYASENLLSVDEKLFLPRHGKSYTNAILHALEKYRTSTFLEIIHYFRLTFIQNHETKSEEDSNGNTLTIIVLFASTGEKEWPFQNSLVSITLK